MHWLDCNRHKASFSWLWKWNLFSKTKSMVLPTTKSPGSPRCGRLWAQMWLGFVPQGLRVSYHFPGWTVRKHVTVGHKWSKTPTLALSSTSERAGASFPCPVAHVIDLKKEQNIRIPYSKLTKDIKDNEIYCAFGFSNLYKIASLSLCLAWHRALQTSVLPGK